jgi:hypothetical protein
VEEFSQQHLPGCSCFTVPEALATGNSRSPSLDPRQTSEPTPKAQTASPATLPPQAAPVAVPFSIVDAEEWLQSNVGEISKKASPVEGVERLLQSLAGMDLSQETFSAPLAPTRCKWWRQQVVARRRSKQEDRER